MDCFATLAMTADYAFGSNPPYGLRKAQHVGRIERTRPPKLNLAKVEAKPIELIATCDGFRKGSTHPASYELRARHCEEPLRRSNPSCFGAPRRWIASAFALRATADKSLRSQ
jgi:hypothetical protein